jgi:CheY-like chemotaxis protein
VRILVTDTGPGIRSEMTARLFTPFDRLGAEQTGVEGTGLGLSLSKRLAEAMNGSIGMRGNPAGGAIFYIELPRAATSQVRLERTTQAGSDAGKRIPAASQKHRVLYVEDNLSNLTLVQRIIALRNDIDLIPAMQGGLALELARSHRPHLVLLDLNLPDIHGEEVFRMLRAAPDCRDIPVVVLSADATPEQIDRMLAAGAHAYITKPLDVKPFIEILDGVLRGREAA